MYKCPHCSSKRLVKQGRLWAKGRRKRQRYLCNNCGRTTMYPRRSRR